MEGGMPAIAELLQRYGYVSLGAALFFEAVGLPVPGAVALVVTGAAVAHGAIHGGAALMVAVSLATRDAVPRHTARFMVRLHTPEVVPLDRG